MLVDSGAVWLRGAAESLSLLRSGSTGFGDGVPLLLSPGEYIVSSGGRMAVRRGSETLPVRLRYSCS